MSSQLPGRLLAEWGGQREGQVFKWTMVVCPKQAWLCGPGRVTARPRELRAGPGQGWRAGGSQYSPLPDVGVHGLGEDEGRGLGDSGAGLEPFYLQEEVCTGGTPKQGH